MPGQQKAPELSLFATCCGVGLDGFGHTKGGILLQLSTRRRSSRSQPQLAVSRARETSLRFSNPDARHADVSLPTQNKYRKSPNSGLFLYLLRGRDLNPNLQVMSLARYRSSTPLCEKDYTLTISLNQDAKYSQTPQIPA